MNATMYLAQYNEPNFFIDTTEPTANVLGSSLQPQQTTVIVDNRHQSNQPIEPMIPNHQIYYQNTPTMDYYGSLSSSSSSSSQPTVELVQEKQQVQQFSPLSEKVSVSSVINDDCPSGQSVQSSSPQSSSSSLHQLKVNNHHSHHYHPFYQANFKVKSTTKNRSNLSNTRSVLKLQHRLMNDLTLKWLEENYELKDNICLPRCLIYRQYLGFMETKHTGRKPIGAAAFGKLVRQKFPKISTRRLGTRGQSKYHYYGISIKPGSQFYKEQTSIVYSQNFGGPTSLLTDLKYHQRSLSDCSNSNNDCKSSGSGGGGSNNNDDINHNGEYFFRQYSDDYFCQHHSHQQTHQPCITQTNHQSSYSQPYNLYCDEIEAKNPVFLNYKQQQSMLTHHYSNDNSLSFNANVFNNQSTQAYFHSNQIKFRNSGSGRHDVKRRNRILLSIKQNSSNDMNGQVESVSENVFHQQPTPLHRNDFEEIERLFDEQCCSIIATSTESNSYFQANYPTLEMIQRFYSAFVDSSTSMTYHTIPTTIFSTFLLMYQAHCRRVLDTFQLANVKELQESVRNFWSEMPDHLAPLMSHPFIYQVVKLIDMVLYRAIEDFLSQLNMISELSDTFVQDTKIILKNMNLWLKESICSRISKLRQSVFDNFIKNIENNDDPECDAQHLIEQTVRLQVDDHLNGLFDVKNSLFETFSISISKQLNFIEMVKECRKQIQQQRSSQQMLADMRLVSVVDSLSTDSNPMLNTNLYEQMKNFNEDFGDDVESRSYHNDYHYHHNDAEQQKWSVEVMLHQIQQQFQLLIKYLQLTINIGKIIHWTRALIVRTIFKCNPSCKKRHSRMLLYGINFFIANVMSELNVINAKSLPLWDKVFVCIREYLVLHLERSDRYETRMASIQQSHQQSTALIKNHDNMGNEGGCKSGQQINQEDKSIVPLLSMNLANSLQSQSLMASRDGAQDQLNKLIPTQAMIQQSQPSPPQKLYYHYNSSLQNNSHEESSLSAAMMVKEAKIDFNGTIYDCHPIQQQQPTVFKTEEIEESESEDCKQQILVQNSHPPPPHHHHQYHYPHYSQHNNDQRQSIISSNNSMLMNNPDEEQMFSTSSSPPSSSSSSPLKQPKTLKYFPNNGEMGLTYTTTDSGQVYACLN